MKTNICTLLLLLTVGLINAQAYKGKGDIKAQVGLNTQNHGTGIVVSADYGLGENMSCGFVASYLISADQYGVSPEFKDRADLKARFNANLGSVLKLDRKMDVYPGLDLSLKNLGAHVGFRYFFSDGFGVYAEAGTPITKFDSNVIGFEKYNNQVYVNIGCSFNL